MSCQKASLASATSASSPTADANSYSLSVAGCSISHHLQPTLRCQTTPSVGPVPTATHPCASSSDSPQRRSSSLLYRPLLLMTRPEHRNTPALLACSPSCSLHLCLNHQIGYSKTLLIPPEQPLFPHHTRPGLHHSVHPELIHPTFTPQPS